MGFRYHWKLVQGLDNVAPYNLRILQFHRIPKNHFGPPPAGTDPWDYVITDAGRQGNKIQYAHTVLLDSVDLAILTPGDYNYWDGKLSEPWELPKGAGLSVWLDDNTEAIVAVCEIIERCDIPKFTRFKTFQLKPNYATILRFPGNTILKRLIFYDLFMFDTANKFWRPQRWTRDTLISPAADNQWLSSKLTVIAQFGGKAPYELCRDIDHYLQVVSGADGRAHIIEADVPLAHNESVTVKLETSLSSTYLERFQFLCIAEYKAVS